MFEELIEKINTIEANVNLLLEQSNSLTTYNDVAKFLGVTRKTIYNYVKEGKLIEECGKFFHSLKSLLNYSKSRIFTEFYN